MILMPEMRSPYTVPTYILAVVELDRPKAKKQIALSGRAGVHPGQRWCG